MAGTPRYKVFTDRQKYIASCKEIQDAAYLAQSYGEGASVRLGHSKKDIVLLIDADHDAKSIDELTNEAIAGEDRRAAQYQQERWQRYEDDTKDWSPEERAMAPNPYGTSAGPYGPGGDQ